MQKKLVVFDLDGTLVKGQSQRLFLEYLFRMRIIRPGHFAWLYAWFALRQMGLARDPEPVMRYAFRLFAGWRADIVESLVKDFFHERLRNAFFPDAAAITNGHDRNFCHVMLVSNAFEAIARNAANHLGIGTAIGTELEAEGGRYTGKIAGFPVFGRHKADRISEHVEKHNLTFTESWAYGDSITDLPVLEMVTNPVAVNPDRELFHEARKRGWRTLRFKE